MNLTRFKIFLLIPIIYLAVLFPLMGFFMADRFASESSGVPGAMAFIIPVHLFAMFCLFYCIYFIAKELKSVEWQRPVSFSDYVGEFFLIWFFPIGVWFIQPRINRIFERNELNDFLDSSNTH